MKIRFYFVTKAIFDIVEEAMATVAPHSQAEKGKNQIMMKFYEYTVKDFLNFFEKFNSLDKKSLIL